MSLILVKTREIPFVDINSLHQPLTEEFLSIFTEVVETGRFIGGPMVERFEDEFASFCTTKYAVGVASGTDALRFALIASGISLGDTVITVPNTFVATAEAISQAGAFVEFVDIDERTYNIDVEMLKDYLSNCKINREGRPISKKSGSPIRALLPVHLYGQMADMDPIVELAENYNLLVIEDACQAHGAEYFSRRKERWQRAGSMGTASAFSFYPGKNLGAFGEAGAVTTNSEAIAERIRMLRDHGQTKKYLHEIEGYNGRLDALQAGVLSVKLKYLEEWNKRRQNIAQRYNELLGEIEEIITPYEPDWVRSVYHLYVIRIPQRDRARAYLKERGIDTGLHYPVPIHLQNAYRWLGYKKGDFPVTEKVTQEILSLPIYPTLTEDDQNYIVEQIKTFLNRV